MSLTADEKKALKRRGYIITRDDEHFIARVITVNGVMTTEQMKVAADAAEKFGNGKIAMTSRLTIEVQGLTADVIEEFDKYIAQAGLYTGGTSAVVRPIVACKGTVCIHGLYDTQKFAEELHEKYYNGWHNIMLPHKFKIGVGGCPNNCIKPSLNDFGIIGQRVPQYEADDCTACTKCAVIDVCPVKICQKDEDGIMQFDPEKCTNCGKCIDKCNFDCISEKQNGFKIVVGGYWGKRQHPGIEIDEIFTKEEVDEMIERSLLLYREQGITGERFGMFIERIGVDNFISQLKSGDVMNRKQEILEAQLHLVGGATC